MVCGGVVFTLHEYCIKHPVIPNWGILLKSKPPLIKQTRFRRSFLSLLNHFRPVFFGFFKESVAVYAIHEHYSYHCSQSWETPCAFDALLYDHEKEICCQGDPKFVFWWHLNALHRNTLGESSVYISTIISGLTHLVNHLWTYAIAYPSTSMGTWLGAFYWIVWSNLPLQSRITIFRRYNFFMRISSHKWFLASFHLIKKK